MQKEEIIRILSHYKGEQVTNHLVEKMYNALLQAEEKEASDLVKKIQTEPIVLSSPSKRKYFVTFYTGYTGTNDYSIVEIDYEELSIISVEREIKSREALLRNAVINITDIKPL